MNNRKTLNNILNQQSTFIKDDRDYSAEDDLYQTCDDRVWESYVEDIKDGDNFADFCEYYFRLLEEEEYFET